MTQSQQANGSHSPASSLPAQSIAAAASTPFAACSDFSLYPRDVGIHAIDIYFPPLYITQQALEQHNQVPAGKYTIGLGQQALTYCSDRDDIYSLALTAVSQFMKKYNVSYSSIGRLEVGTETIADHSKSIKSVLMQLFAQNAPKQSSDNGDSTRGQQIPTFGDVEGIDCMNACYAGTHALFNSVDWIESSSFDGRYALCVAADIAEYAAGPARPTGGCGVVVTLIGPDAPLVLERGCRASHMSHVYDFYKPHLSSPYPVVDGKYSNRCYLEALDACYQRYARKWTQQQRKQKQSTADASLSDDETFDVTRDAAYVVMHAPYNKLVQKSWARMLFNDAHLHPHKSQYDALHKQFDKSECTGDVCYPPALPALASSYDALDLEKALVVLSKPSYAEKISPSTLLPTQLGNMYTASLYAGIVSLIDATGAQLASQRLLCFSYGSGLAASMFSLRCTSDAQRLTAMQQKLQLSTRLADQRHETSCAEFDACMTYRESLHHTDSGFAAKDSTEYHQPGAYYLLAKDDLGKRTYAVKGEKGQKDVAVAACT